jgi:glycosyltransferase involved in cell wall biosynthesis
VTVDLGPGRLLARECVESLRYGTPVIVPAVTAAAELAARGGGLSYRDAAELVGCVDTVGDRGLRDMLGTQGRQFTDDWYGDADRFVDRVGVVLTR